MAPAQGVGRGWKVGIVCGLLLAAALIVVPRFALFAPQGRDGCEERGFDYHGLYEEASGRYGDPVPDGARCIHPSSSGPTVDVPISFFGPSGLLGDLLAWVYRLACVLLPFGLALWIGTRAPSS